MTYNKTLQLRKNDVVRVKSTGEIGTVHTLTGESQYTLVVSVVIGASVRAVSFKELELLKDEFTTSDSKPSVCPICVRRGLSYNFNSLAAEPCSDINEILWECSFCGAKGIELYAQTLFGLEFAGHKITGFGGKQTGAVQPFY